jgi:hypothetical protein
MVVVVNNQFAGGAINAKDPAWVKTPGLTRINRTYVRFSKEALGDKSSPKEKADTSKVCRHGKRSSREVKK